LIQSQQSHLETKMNTDDSVWNFRFIRPSVLDQLFAAMTLLICASQPAETLLRSMHGL
jgi:hypothetical protein